jgi:DUF1009 family protein
MKASGATALAIDAQRTLLFDREALIAAANEARIAIQAFPPESIAEPKTPSKGIDKQ